MAAALAGVLGRLGLEAYAPELEEQGWDDAVHLAGLSTEELQQVAADVGMKRGHSHKFVHNLSTAAQAEALERDPGPDAEASCLSAAPADEAAELALADAPAPAAARSRRPPRTETVPWKLSEQQIASVGDGGLLALRAEHTESGVSAERFRRLFRTSKALAERCDEAEASVRSDREAAKLAESDWLLREEDLEVPQPHRVAKVPGRSGTNVLTKPSWASSDKQPTDEAEELSAGALVAVAGRRGRWLRLADWEEPQGWVAPLADGGEALLPALGVPLEALRLQARALRTARFAAEDADRAAGLVSRARRPPDELSVYNPMLGLEARCAGSRGPPAGPPGMPWAVYTQRPLAAGEEVERCEVLEESSEACQQSSTLGPRTRVWRAATGEWRRLLPLGFGALYRHTEDVQEAAAETVLCRAGPAGSPQLVLRALRAVAAGEELTVADLGAVELEPPPREAVQEEDADQCPVPPLLEGGRLAAGGVQLGPSRVHGRGVFAQRRFAPGDVVEVCPGLILDASAGSCFADYTMNFDESAYRDLPDGLAWAPEGMGVRVLPLGHGACCNHQGAQAHTNVDWKLAPRAGAVVLRATQAIQEGAELFINYGRGYWKDRNAVRNYIVGLPGAPLRPLAAWEDAPPEAAGPRPAPRGLPRAAW